MFCRQFFVREITPAIKTQDFFKFVGNSTIWKIFLFLNHNKGDCLIFLFLNDPTFFVRNNIFFSGGTLRIINCPWVKSSQKC